MGNEEFYVPAADAPDRLDTGFGFTPPTEKTPLNELDFQQDLKPEYYKYSRDKAKLKSLGDSAYLKVPTWWEVLAITEGKHVAEYYCKDHEAKPAERASCNACRENATLRRELVVIDFQPYGGVASSNNGRTHRLYGRIWWGVNEMTDEQLHAARTGESGPDAKTYEGLLKAGRRQRRLMESLVVSVGREDWLKEKTKLDCFARVKWDQLSESGANLVKAKFKFAKSGGDDGPRAEIIEFQKVATEAR